MAGKQKNVISMDAFKKMQSCESEATKKDRQLAALQKEKDRRLKSFVPKADNNDSRLRLRLIQEKKNKASREGAKKHKSKAAGVKSVFTLDKDNTLLMTSFGKGNDAKPEKRVEGSKITNIPAVPAYSALQQNKEFKIEGRADIKAYISNPAFSKKQGGSDLIGLKEKIENRFFGQSFDDNIHIQIAHNIQDIEKIMAVHINNVVYEIDNMLRSDEESFIDIIGFLNLDKTWEKFNKAKSDKDKGKADLVNKLLDQPQLAYFGTVLYDPALVKAQKSAKIDSLKKAAAEKVMQKRKEAFNILCLLGQIRQ